MAVGQVLATREMEDYLLLVTSRLVVLNALQETRLQQLTGSPSKLLLDMAGIVIPAHSKLLEGQFPDADSVGPLAVVTLLVDVAVQASSEIAVEGEVKRGI